MKRLAPYVLLAAPLAGCAILPHSLYVPSDDTATLVLGSVPLDEPLPLVARHAFFVGRSGGTGAPWRSWEWGSGAHVEHDDRGDRVADSWGGVAVHHVWRGPRAGELMVCIEREGARFLNEHSYSFWPGPNSNTYIATILRNCHAGADLPATCVGRDWLGAAGAGATTGNTGVQIETPVFGIRIGLTEGIEVHIFALSFGVDLWPPALIVPFGTGRIGFEDR